MDNAKLEILPLDNMLLEKSLEFLKNRGVSEQLNVKEFYKFEHGKILLLVGKSSAQLYALIFDKQDQVVESIAKSYNILKQEYNIKDLKTEEVETFKNIDINSNRTKNDVATANICPPGQEWRMYNCTTEYKLNPYCLVACVPVRLKPSLCVNLCTFPETTCEGDCFPVGGGILT